MTSKERCIQIWSDYIAASLAASEAHTEMIACNEEHTRLSVRLQEVDDDIVELTDIAGAIQDQLAELTAAQQKLQQEHDARAAEFEAIEERIRVIDARLTAILQELAGGGPEAPVPDPERVAELEAEASSLSLEKQLLLNRRDALVHGGNDPERYEQLDREIEAIDQRINEILAELSGDNGANPDPGRVDELWAEASRLADTRQPLLDDQNALASTAVDPATLQPGIDLLVAEQGETARLLRDVTELHGQISADATAAFQCAEDKLLEENFANHVANDLMLTFEQNNCAEILEKPEQQHEAEEAFRTGVDGLPRGTDARRPAHAQSWTPDARESDL